MEAIYGLALLSASILLLAFAARYRNGPHAAAWMKSGVVLQTILFTVVTGIVFAISMLIQAIAQFGSLPFGMTEIGLLAAIVAVSALCWYAIGKMPAIVPLAPAGPRVEAPPVVGDHDRDLLADALGPDGDTRRLGVAHDVPERLLEHPDADGLGLGR